MCRAQLFGLVVAMLASAPVRLAEEVRVPADLVSQLFEQATPNQAIKKRPFDLRELRDVLQRYAESDEAAVDLTQRYLRISYPAGTLDFLELVRADLAERVKITLLKAPAGSLRLAVTSSLRELLGSVPQPLLSTLFGSAAGLVAFSPPALDIRELLTLNDNRFGQAILYATHTQIGSDDDYYQLSLPRREVHLLDAYLRWGGTAVHSVCFVNTECRAASCFSRGGGESFASFRFAGSDARYPKGGQRVEAKCRYQATYRRTYVARSEVELAFEACTLESLDGVPPRRDPLLEDLERVRQL